MRWQRDDLVLTDEPTPTIVKDTHAMLQTTYWSHKRSLDVVEKAIANSLCFVLLRDDKQVGFARLITDYATTSWLADVILADELQGCGVGTWMMQCVIQHPDVAETQFVLQTGSAHTFYERLGFAGNEALMSTPVDYLPSA